jgi:hypothetical protein
MTDGLSLEMNWNGIPPRRRAGDAAWSAGRCISAPRPRVGLVSRSSSCCRSPVTLFRVRYAPLTPSPQQPQLTM